MFKDREIEPVDAGKAFGVEAVLIGSVQKEDGVFKVTARLVDTVDGRVLWATEIKRPANDIFGLQAEIAREVAVNLQPQSDEAPKIASRPTDNIEAYQDYLRGRFSWNKRTPDSLQKAIGHFERAIQKDQNYTLAYTGLADCYILLAEYNVTTPHDSIPKAAAAVGRALELDAQSAEAYAALGYTQTVYDWNWEAADASFRRALELDPNYATAHQWYGEYLMGVGRFDESRAHLERAIEIEPVSPIILSGLANFHHLRGDYDNEINSSLKVIEIDPSFAYATFYLGLGYEGRGMDAEAADALTRTVMQFGEPLECVHELSEAFKKNGIRGWWQQRLKQVETRPHLKNFQAYFKALILIRLDDKEGTLNALNQAYDRRDRGLAFAKYEPRLDPLRGGPRFENLLRRMGL